MFPPVPAFWRSAGMPPTLETLVRLHILGNRWKKIHRCDECSNVGCTATSIYKIRLLLHNICFSSSREMTLGTLLCTVNQVWISWKTFSTYLISSYLIEKCNPSGCMWTALIQNTMSISFWRNWIPVMFKSVRKDDKSRKESTDSTVSDSRKSLGLCNSSSELGTKGPKWMSDCVCSAGWDFLCRHVRSINHSI